MTVTNLDYHISHDDQRLYVRLEDPDGSILAEKELDWANFWDAVRDYDLAPRQLGDYLAVAGPWFESILLAEPFQEKLRKANSRGDEQTRRIRFRLHVMGEDLERLPWECCYAQDEELAVKAGFKREDGRRYLLGHRHVSMVRVDPDQKGSQTAGAIFGKTIDLLWVGVRAAEPSLDCAFPPISYRQSRNLVVHKLEPPTLDNLKKKLKEGDGFPVVWIATHGPDSGQDDGLWLVDGSGGKKFISAADLAKAFELSGVELVVLSSCRSAGTAWAIARAGIPCVLGMTWTAVDRFLQRLAEFLGMAMNGWGTLEDHLFKFREDLMNFGGASNPHESVNPVLIASRGEPPITESSESYVRRRFLESVIAKTRFHQEGKGRSYQVAIDYPELLLGQGDAEPRSARDLVEDLKEKEDPLVVIRGLPGSGKTMLLKQLAYRLAREALLAEQNQEEMGQPLYPLWLSCNQAADAAQKPENLVPLAIRVTCPSISEDAENLRLLIRELVFLVKSGRAVVLLDGLDDVPKSDRKRLLQWLHDQRSDSEIGMPVTLLSSRPLGSLFDLPYVVPEPLAPVQVLQLIYWREFLKKLEEESLNEAQVSHRLPEDKHRSGNERKTRRSRRERVLRLREIKLMNRSLSPSRALSERLCGHQTIRDLSRTPLLCSMVLGYLESIGNVVDKGAPFKKDDQKDNGNVVDEDGLLEGHVNLALKKMEDLLGYELGLAKHDPDTPWREVLERLALACLTTGGEQALGKKRVSTALTGLRHYHNYDEAEGVLEELENGTGLILREDHDADRWRFPHRVLTEYLASYRAASLICSFDPPGFTLAGLDLCQAFWDPAWSNFFRHLKARLGDNRGVLWELALEITAGVPKDLGECQIDDITRYQTDEGRTEKRLAVIIDKASIEYYPDSQLTEAEIMERYLRSRLSTLICNEHWQEGPDLGPFPAGIPRTGLASWGIGQMPLELYEQFRVEHGRPDPSGSRVEDDFFRAREIVESMADMLVGAIEKAKSVVTLVSLKSPIVNPLRLQLAKKGIASVVITPRCRQLHYW